MNTLPVVLKLKKVRDRFRQTAPKSRSRENGFFLLVDEGDCFCINRARQYGKTTTLQALAEYLKPDYIVIALDFQDIDSAVYENSGPFTKGLARLLIYAKELTDAPVPDKVVEELNCINRTRADEVKMDELFFLFHRWCRESGKKIVLMVDEVDTAVSNQVFLDFLAQLRSGYLNRRAIQTFQSVILAGVTDVKHLHTKIRPEDAYKENSPWNIAADFTIDMSLSEVGIRGMLDDYEADHHTGMDTQMLARLIREYTEGYPFLVSRICQLIDEKVKKAV
ncbi:MAG: AAA-like domain-containing protein, partial [Clostridia bacterium]|nr:AAA-like domain-containing protein [Clostridia bacterium]